MKYALIKRKKNNILQYTYYILEYLIKINNHELVSIKDCEYILFSICDVSEIGELKKIREQYPKKQIIVGGHFAVFYKICLLFCDYVNIGQGFEFFECKSIEQIKRLKSIIWTKSKKKIIASIKIDWNIIPICKITKSSYYYWGSVGCKNKCSFCLTAWTNKYQKNKILNIKKAVNIKKCSIISNDNKGMERIRESRKSIKLKDFLNIRKHYCNYYRIGLEFATEKNRKIIGKFFTNKELYQSIIKACKEKVRIQFFCICGLDDKQEWMKLINNIPTISYGWGIYFKFTNLEYQMFTPLYKKRYNLDISKYMNKQEIENIYYNNRFRVKPLRIRPIKYPAYAIWRTGMTNSINKDQFNLFWELRNKKDLELMYDALIDSKVFDNDYSDTVDFQHKFDIDRFNTSKTGK